MAYSMVYSKTHYVVTTTLIGTQVIRYNTGSAIWPKNSRQMALELTFWMSK